MRFLNYIVIVYSVTIHKRPIYKKPYLLGVCCVLSGYVVEFNITNKSQKINFIEPHIKAVLYENDG